MLRRYGGCIVWECDECGDRLETGTDDFGDARAELREAGWQSEALRNSERKPEWIHLCAACREM